MIGLMHVNGVGGHLYGGKVFHVVVIPIGSTRRLLLSPGRWHDKLGENTGHVLKFDRNGHEDNRMADAKRRESIKDRLLFQRVGSDRVRVK